MFPVFAYCIFRVILYIIIRDKNIMITEIEGRKMGNMEFDGWHHKPRGIVFCVDKTRMIKQDIKYCANHI